MPAASAGVGRGRPGASAAAGARSRRRRRLLRLEEVTEPRIPPKAPDRASTGVTPWMTRAEDFYLIDTAIVRPAIEPKEWSLRIHGMVDREITLTYDDLVARRVHGELDHPQLRVQPGRRRPDRQRLVERRPGGRPAGRGGRRRRRRTPCCRPPPTTGPAARPLAAMTDGRNAMLAVAMNGEPLPIDHGFPVRTIVPGLYGYVSACKWVVDWRSPSSTRSRRTGPSAAGASSAR